jgi:tetratricopeptide (TPR) repeat protein
MGNFLGADAACIAAAERAEATFGPGHRVVVASAVMRAEILLVAGRDEEAAELAESAWQISRESLHRYDAFYVDATLVYARVRQKQGRYEEALRLIDEVDELSLTPHGDESPARYRVMATRAQILVNMYRHEEAIATASEAVRFFTARSQSPNRTLVYLYATMADAAHSLGRSDDAQYWIKACLRNLEGLPTKGLAELLSFLIRASRISIGAESYDDAEGYLLRAGAVAQKMNLEAGMTAAAYNALGAEIAARQGRIEPADSAFRYALQLYRQSNEVVGDGATEVLVRFADFLATQQRWRAAEMLIEEVTTLERPAQYFRGPLYVRGLHVRARVQQALENLAAARTHYATALDVAREALSDRSLLLIPILEDYSALLASQGDAAGAQVLIDEALTLREREDTRLANASIALPLPSGGRHDFPAFNFSYQLSADWVAFDPASMSIPGLLGFMWSDEYVVAVVQAEDLSRYENASSEVVMELAIEMMKQRLDDLSVEDSYDFAVAGIEGRQVSHRHWQIGIEGR